MNQTHAVGEMLTDRCSITGYSDGPSIGLACDRTMRAEEDEKLRGKIAQLLARGLRTQTEPVPETHVEFGQILDELHKLASDDLEQKLIISGFTDKPYGPDQRRCLECMYYLVHRKWCDLPEQSIPVEPDWWCRLWRI